MVRNRSIDAFRVIANWVVVCVHTAPFTSLAFSPQVRLYGELLNQFVRVATPFFFLAAGYFFAVSTARGAEPIALAGKLIRRLALFFVFWSLVYILVPVIAWSRNPSMSYEAAVHFMIVRSMSAHTLLSGTAFHLWFLPALSCGLAMLALACRLHLERALLGLAAALYVLGLIGGAYKATPIGIDLGINTRNGPFFGSLFVMSGFMLQRLKLEWTVRSALGLMTLGICMRVMELLWISGIFGTSPGDIDYLLGTYPFGLGVFILLLTWHGLGEFEWMVRLSRYSAGVYCAHALVVEWLGQTTVKLHDPVWEIGRPFVALALTFALVTTLAKIRDLRPVLS